MSSSEDEEPSYDDMRNYLRNFRGGRVIMDKNEETGIATLCFDNNRKKNAISGYMMVDLREHLLVLEQWLEGKAVILFGDGNFCSGGDLEMAVRTGNQKGAQYISRWMQDTLMLLHRLPLISMCVLSGASLGGGAEISVYCDYLIATEDVSFGFIHATLEIIPVYGGITMLIKKLGYEKGLDLLLTAKIIDAEECLNIGLVETIIPKESYYESAIAWTQKRVLRNHTITRALKQVALKADHAELEKALAFERDIFCPFWGSPRNKYVLKTKIRSS